MIGNQNTDSGQSTVSSSSAVVDATNSGSILVAEASGCTFQVSEPDPNFYPFRALDIPASNHPDSTQSHPEDNTAALDGLLSGNYHFDEKDIIIAVMGPTGAGKSSFVNTAAGRTEVAIGYDLTSHTRGVQPVRCLHPDGLRNVVLIDTPGFDDTHLSDTQILRVIAHWLKETYQNNIKLDGILYLHRISDNRLGGTPLRNLSVFRDLCGDDGLKNVILVTTMWDEIDGDEVGTEREEELLSNFWKDMVHLGSRTNRFAGDHNSAWEIIRHLEFRGSRENRTPLQIQREMVDRGLLLHETTAAKTLLRFLKQLISEFKRAWKRIRNKTPKSTGTKKRPDGIGRSLPLRRFPTTKSTSSVTSRSDGSITGSLTTTSSGSAEATTPGTVSSGCSALNRQDTLVAVVNGLRLAYQMADLTSVPGLKGAIGTMLQITQMIQGMGGVHHAINQVVENAGWLLQEIADYTTTSKLSKDMRRAFNSFQKELEHLRNVVDKISNRGRVARFFLHDADLGAITECANTIKLVYDKLEVKLALDNHQAIARLQEQLTELASGTILRQCQCGMAYMQGEGEGSSRGQSRGNGDGND